MYIAGSPQHHAGQHDPHQDEAAEEEEGKYEGDREAEGAEGTAKEPGGAGYPTHTGGEGQEVPTAGDDAQSGVSPADPGQQRRE